MWWGKLLGSAVGFVPGGPAGMAVGFMLGHIVDRLFKRWRGGMRRRRPDSRTHQTIFRITFLCLGHLAKAKGRITESDIEYARSVMNMLSLDNAQRQQAMIFYGEGKLPEFDLKQALSTLRQTVRGHPQLLHLFMETQIAAAYADGQMGASDQAVLKAFSRGLGVNTVQFQWLHARVVAQQRAEAQAAQQHGQSMPLEKAYSVLAVTAQESDKDVKQAYRRAMSQNHPDKLMAQGLTEAQHRVASEKVHEIQLAHETIMTHRRGSL